MIFTPLLFVIIIFYLLVIHPAQRRQKRTGQVAQKNLGSVKEPPSRQETDHGQPVGGGVAATNFSPNRVRQLLILTLTLIVGLSGLFLWKRHRDNEEKKVVAAEADRRVQERTNAETDRAKRIADYLSSISHHVRGIGPDVHVLREPTPSRIQIEAAIGGPDYVSSNGSDTIYLAFAPKSYVTIQDDWVPTANAARLESPRQETINANTVRIIDSAQELAEFRFYVSDNKVLAQKKGDLSDIIIGNCDVFTYRESCSY
jgi:hypothetical protein